MQKKKELTARITNESGRDISKELAEYVAKLYIEGKLKIKN